MYLSISKPLRIFCAFLAVPQDCLVCGSPARSGVPLCAACLEKRFLAPARSLADSAGNHERCLKCGRPLISSQGLCTVCKETDMLAYIDRIFPLFPYDAYGQDLLVSWKIRGMRGLSELYADILAEFISGSPELSGLPVVPVPPRPGKMKEKGWDQVRELSFFLSRKHHIYVFDCLTRTSWMQQKKLGRAERFSNMKGRFSMKSAMKIPERVIVLDDLVTTGSTLDACAEALKGANCGKVYGLTLFYD